MMTVAPTIVTSAPRPVSEVCCAACSIASTSRITLACNTPALTREW